MFDANINKPENIRKGLAKGLAKNFPVDLGNEVIELKDVEFKPTKLSPNKWKDINIARKEKHTIGDEVIGHFVIKNKNTGKTLDSAKIRLGILPQKSNLIHSFIVNGVAYDVPLQSRLKAGAYARMTNTGQIEVFNNVINGVGFRNTIDPQTKKITLKIRQGSYALYPILKLLNVPDEKIKEKLGKEIYEANKTINIDTTLSKLYRALFKKSTDDKELMYKRLREFFLQMRTRPEVNITTIGKPYDKINGDYLLDTTVHAIDILKKKKPLDNRDAPLYKEIFGVEDTLEDHLNRASKRHMFEYKIKLSRNKGNTDLKKLIPHRDIAKYIEKFFSSSRLSKYSEQINPVAMLSAEKHITSLGEGGIGTSKAVTESAKMINDGEMGFFDPVNTPESDKAGITLSITLDTIKAGKTLKTKVINVKTGKTEYLSLDDTLTTPIAFPDEFKLVNGKYVPKKRMIYAVVKDKKQLMPASRVKYMISSPDALFGIQSNTVPFKDSNQANRLLTAGKMSIQAVPLANPEVPLVRPVVLGKDFYKEIAKSFSFYSPVDGIVEKITPDEIQIMDTHGKKHFVELPNDVPLNDESFISAIVKVKVGDKVKKGQLLADTNFTKEGIYAPGVNLVTAYFPFRGYNHEDAVVITESAANKLKSVHLKKLTLPIGRNDKLDLKLFKAHAPYTIAKMDLNKYTDDGIIKPGTPINKGDVLVALIKKTTPSAADNLIMKLRKSKFQTYKDSPLTWDHDYPGIVSDVVKRPGYIDIYVKTVEGVNIDDKITGRHGNKTTISRIIPDALAPRTVSGEKIEVILDPHSVPSRINTGQILETAAGKIADKTGKEYLVPSFEDKSNVDKIIKDSQKYNIPQYEDIYDPETGKIIPKVQVGKQYFLKLKHMSEHKMSARGTSEPYTKNNQPIAGKGVGGVAIDTLTSNVLLSYNARNLLREFLSIKNNPNADYWRAIQAGEVPPLPTTPAEWDKFNDLLKGMGVNMVQKGTSFKVTPLTDKQIKEISAGEIKDPTKFFRGAGDKLKPYPEGLFGDVAGGLQGDKFTYIKLKDPIINPTYKKAIKDLLHLNDKELEKFIKGEYDGKIIRDIKKG